MFSVPHAGKRLICGTLLVGWLALLPLQAADDQWKPVGDLSGTIALTRSECSDKVGEGKFLHCLNTVQDEEGKDRSNEERCLFKVQGKGTWCNDRGRDAKPRYAYQDVEVTGEVEDVVWTCLPPEAGIFKEYKGDELAAIFVPSEKHFQKILIRAKIQGESFPAEPPIEDPRTATIEWEQDNPNNYLTTFCVGIRLIAMGSDGVADWTKDNGGKDISEFDNAFSRTVVDGDFYAWVLKELNEEWVAPYWKRNPITRNFQPEYNTYYNVYYAYSSNNLFHPTSTGSTTASLGFKVTGPQVGVEAHTSTRLLGKVVTYAISKIGPVLAKAAGTASGPYGVVVTPAANKVIEYCVSYIGKKNLEYLNARAAFYAETMVNGVVKKVVADARAHPDDIESSSVSKDTLAEALSSMTSITGNPQVNIKCRIGVESAAVVVSDDEKDHAHAVVCGAENGQIRSNLDRVNMTAAYQVGKPFYTRKNTIAELRP